MCAEEAFLSLQKIEINLLVKEKKTQIVVKRRAPGNYEKSFLCEAHKTQSEYLHLDGV